MSLKGLELNEDLSNKEYSNFIALSRYARWLPEESRRETWFETVERYCDYWLNKGLINESLRNELFTSIYNLDVMPSMRALMTAGKALDRDNMANFNCSFLSINRVRAFDEILYILACGTGLGFSCERQEIVNLPEISDEFFNSDTVISVRDSKIGWATAFKELISLLYKGTIPKWDVSKVRPSGAPLKTFGGRASGPQPLVDLFNYTVVLFKKAKGRKLNSLEVHGLVCKIAEIIVVGGVRRCLPDNALVTTPTGLKKMVDITVGDQIVSGGRFSKVSAKVDSGKQQTVIVNHKYGHSEMTPNHRIAVFDSMDSYTFKEAGSLVAGDRLVWDLVGFKGVGQSLPRASYKGHFNSKEFKIPETLTHHVAWLIGLVHGDGYVSSKTIEVAGHIDQWSTLERANCVFEEFFGVKGVVSKDGRDGKGIRLRVNSKGLALWFAENVKTPNNPIAIPDFIKMSLSSNRKAYLAGVIDSDGRLRDDGVIDQTTTIYEGFAEDLKELLSGLGVPSIVKFRSAKVRRDSGVKAKDFWTVSVKGNTGRKMWFNGVGAYSEKASYFEIGSFKSPHDFSYPAEWGLTYRNRSSMRSTLVDNGELNEGFEFAPVEVFSVDLGSVKQTWDIEVEGIHEFTADALVTHNSALISLSNLSDDRMRHAKSGNWWEHNPEFALSNNSVAYTEKPDIESFMREWISLIESKSGERGIFNRQGAIKKSNGLGRREGDKIKGINPCAEILLRDCGVCNLSEVVIRKNDTLESLKKKVRIATILGTLQSTMTDFRYVSKQWKINAEEECLLGVSLTGIMDCELTNNPYDGLPDVLTSLKEEAISVNKEYALKFGINQSVAVTTVKPSGCTTLDTKVKTEEGSKSLGEIFQDNGYSLDDLRKLDDGTWLELKKEIKVYDVDNNLQQVTKLFVNGFEDVHEITFEDGNRYTFTGNHKLKTYNGWKRVDELTIDDEIVSF